jgi:hypothetical protein
MKGDPTSQMPKMCIVLIFKWKYYEPIQVLEPKIQRRFKNKLVPTMISNI